MQILAISPSRRSNQVWLKFDDQSFLPLKIDDLVNLKIKKHTDLSDDQYLAIQTQSVDFVVYEYVLRQIAFSPKVESLVRQKLNIFSQKLQQKYHYPPAIVSAQAESVIGRVTTLGYLDEQAYVDYLIRKHSNKSISEINYKLKSLGIDISVPFSSSTEISKIKDIISKKYKRVDYSDYNAKNKVIAKLYRKGFALEFIKTAIDERSKVR